MYLPRKVVMQFKGLEKTTRRHVFGFATGPVGSGNSVFSCTTDHYYVGKYGEPARKTRARSVVRRRS
jgi:hypothetical protein